MDGGIRGGSKHSVITAKKNALSAWKLHLFN